MNTADFAAVYARIQSVTDWASNTARGNYEYQN